MSHSTPSSPSVWFHGSRHIQNTCRKKISWKCAWKKEWFNILNQGIPFDVDVNFYKYKQRYMCIRYFSPRACLHNPYTEVTKFAHLLSVWYTWIVSYVYSSLHFLETGLTDHNPDICIGEPEGSFDHMLSVYKELHKVYHRRYMERKAIW